MGEGTNIIITEDIVITATRVEAIIIEVARLAPITLQTQAVADIITEDNRFTFLGFYLGRQGVLLG